MFKNLQIGPTIHKQTGKTGEDRRALPAHTMKTGDNRGEPGTTADNHAKSRKTLKVAQTMAKHIKKQRWFIENNQKPLSIDKNASHMRKRC